MRTRPLLTSVTVLTLALGLAACGTVDVGSPTTQDREIEDVTAVSLQTWGDLTVVRGDAPSLTVTAGERVIDHLTSDVDDGLLVLAADGSRWGGLGDVEYRLVLPELNGVEVAGSGDVRVDAVDGAAFAVAVAGSGDVRVDDVDVDAVTVRISGSGGVTLDGTARDQTVDVSGSGSYRAASLTTQSAAVSIEGSGGAQVHVTGELDVVVAGSGTVTYTGGAAVTSSVTGSGGVREG